MADGDLDPEIEKLIEHAAYALGYEVPENEVIEDLQDQYDVSWAKAYLATRAATLLLRQRENRRRWSA